MKPREAFELAQNLIDHYDRVEVIAVGTFVTDEDRTPDTPWAISVSIDGQVRRTVIRSHAEVMTFANVSEPRSRLGKKPVALIEHAQTSGMLF